MGKHSKRKTNKLFRYLIYVITTSVLALTLGFIIGRIILMWIPNL